MVNKLTYLVFIFLVSGCASTSKEENKLGYNGLVNESSENLGALQSLANLKNNPDAKFRIDRGWTIVDVNSKHEQSIYSFTPESHPAYPSIVKREIIEIDGSIHIDMSAKCGASKEVCDELIQQFLALNNKISQSMQK